MRALVFSAMALIGACASTYGVPPPVNLTAYFGPLRTPPTAAELATTEVITSPAWTARPNGQDYFAAYPRNAIAVSADGRVRLDCLVEAGGALRCAAQDDGAPDYDFETAALYIANRFVMAPNDAEGTPTAGKRYRLIIVFRIIHN